MQRLLAVSHPLGTLTPTLPVSLPDCARAECPLQGRGCLRLLEDTEYEKRPQPSRTDLGDHIKPSTFGMLSMVSRDPKHLDCHCSITFPINCERIARNTFVSSVLVKAGEHAIPTVCILSIQKNIPWSSVFLGWQGAQLHRWPSEISILNSGKFSECSFLICYEATERT